MINRKKKAKICEKFCFNFQGLIFKLQLINLVNEHNIKKMNIAGIIIIIMHTYILTIYQLKHKSICTN